MPLPDISMTNFHFVILIILFVLFLSFNISVVWFYLVICYVSFSDLCAWRPTPPARHHLSPGCQCRGPGHAHALPPPAGPILLLKSFDLQALFGQANEAMVGGRTEPFVEQMEATCDGVGVVLAGRPLPPPGAIGCMTPIPTLGLGKEVATEDWLS